MAELGSSKHFSKHSKINRKLGEIFRSSALFMPALFFIVCAAIVLVAPRLIIVSVVSFFVFLALIAAYAAWKLHHLRLRIQRLAQTVEARVVIGRLSSKDFSLPEGEGEEEPKKIVYH